MMYPLRYMVRSWWWKRFHPVTRAGWITATAGRSRSTSQTILGIGLVAAGFILRKSQRTTAVYRGTIEPGSGTMIRVYRGKTVIADEPIVS